MKSRLGTVLVIAALMAAGTWLAGWWALVVVAVAWPLLDRWCPAWCVGIAGMLAWGTLLLAIPLEPLERLTGRLAGIFRLPPWALVLLVLGYAVLLAWSAARLVRAFVPARVSPSSSRR